MDNTGDAMKLIGDAIKGATDAANTLDPDEILDPNRALTMPRTWRKNKTSWVSCCNRSARKPW